MKLFTCSRIVLLSFVLSLLSACHTFESDLIAENHKAARSLIRMAGNEISPSFNMMAASFANVDDLEKSSSFGRMASQQLVTQFTAQGYAFVDILLRDNVYVSQDQGEFLLSRQVNAIGQEHNASVVLVGTYAVGQEHVFVTAKLIRSGDGVIVASHDYSVPNTRETRRLLSDRR